MSNQSEHYRVIAWFAGSDTGLSSEAIAAAMAGIVQPNSSTPLDPSDLGRCLRLLRLFPEWTPERFVATMSGVSHAWRCFAEDWSALAASMAEEVGIDWSKGQSAPKTYDLMKATSRRAIESDPDIEILGRDADGTPWHWQTKRGHTMRAEAPTPQPEGQ